MQNELNQYEIMFILEVIDSVQTKEKICEIIKDHKGELINQEDFGLKDLAYPIKKRNKGFYFLVNVYFPPSSLLFFNKDILLNEKILKYIYLLVKNKNFVRRGKKKIFIGNKNEKILNQNSSNKKIDNNTEKTQEKDNNIKIK